MLLLPSQPAWHITRRTLLRGPHYKWKFTTTLLRNDRMPRLYLPLPELLLCNTESGARGGVVVKALRYKPAGRGFDSRCCHWNFSVT